jgi:hypothetical protein
VEGGGKKNWEVKSIEDINEAHQILLVKGRTVRRG